MARKLITPPPSPLAVRGTLTDVSGTSFGGLEPGT